MDENAFARVIEEGRAVQERFPELQAVAVGGTAVALHCGHRFSLDVDVVTPRLREKYLEIAESLDRWEGWRTNRKNPPVLILGERHGVELGVRQQRREVPLQTTTVRGLIVPTIREMLRVKAFLLLERRATRDYVDVAALARQSGEAGSLMALGYLNRAYAPMGAQSMVTLFAEACELEPLDLESVRLSSYKGLQPPFTEWSHVAEACRRLGRKLLKLELQGVLPATLDDGFYERQ